MFGRATIRLGIGPHSSSLFFTTNSIKKHTLHCTQRTQIILRLYSLHHNLLISHVLATVKVSKDGQSKAESRQD